MCDLLDPIFTCNLQKLESLLHLGRDVNSEIPGTEGLTALHISVGIETPEGQKLVLYLLEHGASPNSRSFDKLTPVHIATMWNNCFNLEMLLKHGGDPWLTDDENKNSFDMALDHHAYEAFQLLNKFISFEMLMPEQKALAYRNGFLYHKNVLSQSEKIHNASKRDILDIFLSDSEDSDNPKFQTANECFPFSISSSEDEMNELCCNVSKFLKKKNENTKTKDNQDGDCLNVNSDCDNVSKSSTEKYTVADEYNKYKEDTHSNIVFETESLNNGLDSDSPASTILKDDSLNKAFILTSTDSENSDTLIYSISQLDNQSIEIDTDAETGIVLVEQSSSSVHTNLSKDCDISLCSIGNDWRVFQNEKTDSVISECSNHKSFNKVIPDELQKLSNSKLYEELKNLGDDPGPIQDCTRQTYLQRLARLKSGCLTICILPKPKYCSEIYQFLDGKLDMERVQKLEDIMTAEFDSTSLTKKWREGTQRCSFNYFLLDPRVTKNLPARSNQLTQKEKFITFIDSLFYVGKGTRGRPYCHLFEAAKAMNSSQPKCEKIAHILDIWNADLGVISLHCFNNCIPVEAYTREACMIEAIGLSNLTNIKSGNFYGVSTRWTMSRKRQLGISFLHTALEIFLLEGERLIRPKDIRS